MATITLRTARNGSKSYRVEVRLKGCPAQRATFARLTDAKRWAQQTEAAIREGRHFGAIEAKRHTVADLIDRYARDVLPTKKAKTRGPQAQQLAWWRNRIGERTLADCSPALIAECRDALAREPIPSQAKNETKAGPERTRSPATVNRYLAVLSHAFSVAVKEWGWIEANPLAKVTKPKEPRGRVRFLDDDERERFLNACKASQSPDLHVAVILALSTGARQQEVLGLRWGQIDLNRRVAILHETKNGERRVLPLSGPALDLLRERSKIRRLDTDLVFPGRADPSKPVDLRTPSRPRSRRRESRISIGTTYATPRRAISR
jgi:integrase